MTGHIETKRTLFNRTPNIVGQEPAVTAPAPPTLETIIAGWREIDPAVAVTAELREQTIAEYIEFHNIDNGNKTLKHTHNTMTDDQYTRHNLPSIATIHRIALERDDPEMKASSGGAIYALYTALTYFNNYARSHHYSPGETLANMRSGVIKGDRSYSTFLALMAYARWLAYDAIKGNFDKIDPNLTINVGKSKPDNWAHRAEHALNEFEESEFGVDVGLEFQRRLFDPATKVLVLSCDVNSTLNTGDTNSNLQYLDTLAAQLKMLGEVFHQKFPDKKLYVVLNTGRPTHYAWGVSDMISSVPEMREFHVAESGGVVVHIDGPLIHPEVAVDNPNMWKEQLNGLKAHLLTQMHNHRDVEVEDKMSMLSIRIANRREDGGEMLLKTDTGETVTESWIKEQVKIYLKNKKQGINSQIKEILKRQKMNPDVERYINMLSQGGFDGIPGTDDDVPENLLRALQDNFADVTEFRTQELTELQEVLDTINRMDEKLVAVFNPTAGFMDIYHGDLNKYSTVMREITRTTGQHRHEILFIHIGDSTTDIIPQEKTGSGQVNEGAKEAFLVGTQNSSENLRHVINMRKANQHGLITARREILGVLDLVLGITNSIKQGVPAT